MGGYQCRRACMGMSQSRRQFKDARLPSHIGRGVDISLSMHIDTYAMYTHSEVGRDRRRSETYMMVTRVSLTCCCLDIQILLPGGELAFTENTLADRHNSDVSSMHCMRCWVRYTRFTRSRSCTASTGAPYYPLSDTAQSSQVPPGTDQR